MFGGGGGSARSRFITTLRSEAMRLPTVCMAATVDPASRVKNRTFSRPGCRPAASLTDLKRFFGGAHEGRAHRARRLALRPEHVAVDDERLLVAEPLQQVIAYTLPVFSLKNIGTV